MARITSEMFSRGDVLAIEFEVMKVTEDEENTIIALRPLEAEDEETWLHLPEQQLNEVLTGDVKRAKPEPAAKAAAPQAQLDVDKLIDRLSDVIDAKIDQRLGDLTEPEPAEETGKKREKVTA